MERMSSISSTRSNASTVASVALSCSPALRNTWKSQAIALRVICSRYVFELADGFGEPVDGVASI